MHIWVSWRKKQKTQESVQSENSAVGQKTGKEDELMEGGRKGKLK